MKCEKCDKRGCIKDGIIKGKQRWYCKGCEHRFRGRLTVMGSTLDRIRKHVYERFKTHEEGKQKRSLRSLAGEFGLSRETVRRWVRDREIVDKLARTEVKQKLMENKVDRHAYKLAMLEKQVDGFAEMMEYLREAEKEKQVKKNRILKELGGKRRKFRSRVP